MRVQSGEENYRRTFKITTIEHLTPIELIKDRLNEYQKALQKSFKSYQENHITKLVHDEHKKNLEPKIFQYKQAVNILENWIE